jgi:hypothetical protein
VHNTGIVCCILPANLAFLALKYSTDVLSTSFKPRLLFGRDADTAGTVVRFDSFHLVEASQVLELVEVVVVVVAADTVIKLVSTATLSSISISLNFCSSFRDTLGRFPVAVLNACNSELHRFCKIIRLFIF